MIINRLIIEEGIDKSDDIFSKNSNLILSDVNSKGKSTFLRLIFYALGYQIPNMKGLDFNQLYTEIHITEKNMKYILKRSGDHLILKNNNSELNFLLPNEHNAMLSYIFQYENISVIKNLLGIIYIDQDKGWSLLNRGVVIGKIKFNIEELLLGLKNINCDKLFAEREKLIDEKKKYESLVEINELSEQAYKENGDIFISDFENKICSNIKLAKVKIKEIQEDIKSIESILKKEKDLFEFINQMNIVVEKDGVTIPVTKDTIKWANESHDFLRARKSLLLVELNKEKYNIAKLNDQLTQYYSNNSLLNKLSGESQEIVINRKLSEFYVDQDMLTSLINKNSKELKKINKTLKSIIKTNNIFITKIYEHVYEYANKLRISDKMVNKEDFIFTSDLKTMSGAILQKMVFAFKLAFLKVIEEELNTKLFMVIDSPRSKELDDKNFKLLENLICEELKDNQFFVASIYNFKVDNVIKISQKAIEKRN